MFLIVGSCMALIVLALCIDTIELPSLTDELDEKGAALMDPTIEAGLVRVETAVADLRILLEGGTPVPPDVGFDLEDVKVLGSNAACLTFPETARLTHFGLVPGEMTILTTGTAHWPEVVIEPGGSPAQAATLWVFLFISGQWYGTGAERLRASQLNGTKPEGALETLIGQDWLYDPNRWGVMAGYNPIPGETVGVMVVAGSTRSDDQTPVQERSDVVLFQWPRHEGANPVVRV